MRSPPVIVKLGGSLLSGPPPRPLLQRLARQRGAILVPGGGSFADAVRDAQPRLGLSEGACHAMAILAMEQTAYALADLCPALARCHSQADLAAPRSGAALWFPAAMLLGAADIPASWDVTSDSLALWLAARLGARRLVLVKAPGAAVPRAPAVADLATLAQAGLVDRAFPQMARGFAGTIVLVNADDSARLEAALGSGAEMDP
ncbi:aspartate kinase [Xanthobacter sp. KR7-225]|uniref:amino acid kinase family protein n=1 Tax=Xanthobacter sp. KR7-225 TaxID=3156613 RepID=UPI0032B348F5